MLAACRLLDEEGSAGFSMAKLGQRLGVTAMALYRHVEDRDDLEQAILDHTLADLVLDEHPDDDWERGVARWMHAVHDHWVRHPWIGALIRGERHSLSPSWLTALGRLAAVLQRAGLTTDEVARELTQISRVVVGVTMLEVRAPLPQVDAFGPDTLERLAPPERARWEALAPALVRYGNEVLFDDLVAQTIDRIRTRTRRR